MFIEVQEKITIGEFTEARLSKIVSHISTELDTKSILAVLNKV